MQTITTGVLFGFIFYIMVTGTPWVDTSWIDQMLGLSKLEMALLSMFVLIGFYMGTLSQGVSDLHKTARRDQLRD